MPLLSSGSNHRFYGRTPPALFLWTATLASLVNVSLASPAVAQSAGAPTSDANGLNQPSDSGRLEEIVVSAQRRLENQQNVPLAITAISAGDLARNGTSGTQDLGQAVPGLVINTVVAAGAPFLRGVGSDQIEPASEPSVATYVDGVYIASPQANLFSFNNIDRIEVLKGPQGTLFGRNASGGVIQVITRDPSDDLHTDVSLGYANYADVTASAYVTGGVTKTLNGDLAFLFENQGRGWGHDLTTHTQNEQLALDNFAVRSKWLWTPGESTRIRMSIDYAKSAAHNQWQFAPPVPDPVGDKYPGPFNSWGALPDTQRVKTGGIAAQIDQDLSAIRIVNIVSYRFTDALYSKDAGMSVPIFHLYEKGKQHDISEELQFQSKGNSRFRWIAGLYYLNNLAGYPQEDIVIGNPVTVTPPVSPPHAYISTQSYAGFGQGTVNVLPKLDLVVGGRYSFDKDSARWPNPGPGDEHTFTKFTYRVALDYHFADDTLGYVSANRGFKSGGFNPLLRDNEYLPEILTSYAAGIKSEFLEHRLRLNAEGYLYHYQDIQVLIPTFTGNLIANATAARMKGLEATLDAEPIRNLRVSAAFALENGEYLDYPGVQTITQQGAVLAPFNAKRKNTLQTPRATENLMASYRFQTSVGTFAAAVSAYHNAGYAFTTDNLLNQPAYTTLNAALTWAAPDEQFDIRFWGKNLTNAIVYQGRFAVSGFGWVQTQAAPTTYGVTFSAHLH